MQYFDTLLMSKDFYEIMLPFYRRHGCGIGDVLSVDVDGGVYDVRKSFQFDTQIEINSFKFLNGVYMLGYLYKDDEPYANGNICLFTGLHSEMVISHYYEVSRFQFQHPNICIVLLKF